MRRHILLLVVFLIGSTTPILTAQYQRHFIVYANPATYIYEQTGSWAIYTYERCSADTDSASLKRITIEQVEETAITYTWEEFNPVWGWKDSPNLTSNANQSTSFWLVENATIGSSLLDIALWGDFKSSMATIQNLTTRIDAMTGQRILHVQAEEYTTDYRTGNYSIEIFYDAYSRLALLITIQPGFLPYNHYWELHKTNVVWGLPLLGQIVEEDSRWLPVCWQVLTVILCYLVVTFIQRIFKKEIPS